MASALARLRAGAGFLALALLILPWLRTEASAHAVLLASEPAADAAVAESPRRIALDFNEPVQLLAMRIIDSSGRDRSPAGAPQLRDGRVVWPIDGPLPDGRYLVSWRVTSLDGHVVGGSFGFAIGVAGKAAPAAPVGDQPHWPALGLHALVRVLTLFAVGTVLFRLLLAPPESLDPALQRAVRRLAIGGVLASLLFLGAEGALRAGLPVFEALAADTWRAALAAPSLPLRAASIAGLTLLAVARRRAPQGLGAALALAGMGDSGHVLALLPPGLGQGLMILHGLVAALWIGAIGPLRLALARAPGAPSAALFRRFQTWGAIAMAATLASGIILAALLLPRWSDLWHSDYGLRLCAKLAAVTLMLAIAATNRLWLTRRALADAPRMRARLRLVLGLDLIAAVLAIVLAVGLSIGPPPGGSLQASLESDRYAVLLTLSPGRAGDNDLTLDLSPGQGAPADPQEVDVLLSAPGIEPIVRKAERVAAGQYRARGLPLWVAGPWRVRVGLLVDDFTKLQLEADLDLPR